MSDPADQAQEREQIARDEALAMQALTMMGPPSTGYCELCEGAIDPKRLAVLPNAKRCIECARIAERKAARHGARA